METNGLIIVIVAVFLAGAFSLVLVWSSRSRQTGEFKERFDPDYEHAVQQYDDPQKPEADLRARQQWVRASHSRPLARGKFANAADKTVADADRVVRQVMQQRGYPAGEFKLRAGDILVDRPNVMTHFERTSYIVELLSTNPDMNNWRRMIAKPSSRIELL